MKKRNYFVIILLVILFASSLLVLDVMAQDQPPEGKTDDSPVAGGGCSPLASGGPDTFGYTYRDSAQLDGPDYSWVEISGFGTPVLLADDAYTGTLPIDFPFNFYGTDYTEFYVDSNGVINFDDLYIHWTNNCPLPEVGEDNNLIALMWDDLDPGENSDPVYYYTFPVGECPYSGYEGACLVVQYENFHHYLAGGGAIAGTFEAVLFDNNDILLQYEDAGAEEGLESTTGIENADGSDGLTYACDNAGSLRDGRSIQFYYPESRLSTSRKWATSVVELGDRIDYTIEIANSGNLPAANANLTDVLPAGTTYIPGSLTCSSGTCSYVSIDKAVYWNGTLEPVLAESYRPTEGELLIPQGDRNEPQATSDYVTNLALEIIPGSAPPGTVLENFNNTWDISTLGLAYNPNLDLVRYAHELFTTADIWDVNYTTPHATLGSILLSAVNPGWPAGLDMRDGIGYDSVMNTYFMPDYRGDGLNADDNIIEIAPDGTILNAWELGDAVGSNDSYDGAAIDSIFDIAVVPGTPPRYFVTTAEGTSTIYLIDLIKTGTWWTPGTWGLLGSCTVPGLADNLGIDYDAEHGLLYHSDSGSTNIVVTDLECHVVNAFTCASPSGFNSGVTYIEGKNEPEIWVTDSSSNSTTRCTATGGPPCDQSATIFYEDFESGLGNWAMTGLWNEEHEADTCGGLVEPFPSPDTDAYFGLDSTCTYSTGMQITGTLEMMVDVDLTNYRYASLNFMSYEKTECNGYCTWDRRYVDVSTDGGTTWATIWASTGPEGSWYQASANLLNYVGGPVRLRFRFDSLDQYANNFFGWMVDNVEIVGCPLPVELTFSVEAPDWCGPVVNQAVLTDTQAESVTLEATTQVVEDLYQSWDFENDDGGFVRSLPGEWEWGVPTYPPGLSAHSGDKVWGTDLHGDANDEIVEHRLTKSVSLPTHPNGIFLGWWDWNGAEIGDHIKVYVEGIQVYDEQDHDQRTWVHHEVDISAWAGLTVDIEFILETCCMNPGPDGWYIDDVAIFGGCVANAQVSPPTFEAQACVDCTVTSTLTICNDDNLPLKWRVWEKQANTVQAEVSAPSANDSSTGESEPRSGSQVNGTAGIQQASQVTGSSCLVALTSDLGVEPIEAAQLHGTLTELGYDWVDVVSVQEARDAGANILIDRYAGVRLPVSDINAWLNDSLGYIQLGDWPDWFPNWWESQPASTPLTITVVDSGHPLAAGLPSSWIGLGFFAYTDSWDENALGWVTDPTYPNIISAGYSTTHERAVSTAQFGAGRAAYIGFNTYGSLAGIYDKQVLKNAIDWTGHCTEIPWLAEAPTDGVVLPNTCTDADITFDATGLAPDDYFADLVVQSNDIYSPVITLPVTFTVIDVAGLSLSMADDPDPVVLGDTLFYTLGIANAGTCTANNVKLVDTLPAGVTYIGASHGGCSQAGGVVTCNLGDLPSGETISLTITVRAPETVGQITNTAIVSSDSEDPDPSNNTASAHTDVRPNYIYLPLVIKRP